MATVSHAVNNQTGPEIGLQSGACVISIRRICSYTGAERMEQAANNVDPVPQLSFCSDLQIKDHT
jgi:hypothetical protein